MDWLEIASKKPIYLNLGGGSFCHPMAGYENYISVDEKPHSGSGWVVKHDLTKPVPLPDNSVDRILAEDCLEHLKIEDIKYVLAEAFRLLKPGGIMRIGVPDYNNPKDHPYLEKGSDIRYPQHSTLTHYSLMLEIIRESLFSRYGFYHYWDQGQFIQHKIDYGLGMVRRTPDNCPDNRRWGLLGKIKGLVRDILYLFSSGARFSLQGLSVQRGHHLYTTSLVVDLFKD